MFKRIGGRRTTKKAVPINACATEKDVERGILHYLSTLPNVYAWKQNSVGVFDPKKGIYRLPNSPYIIRGISDILGIISEGLCLTGDLHKTCGRFLAIEVKSPRRRNNVSDDQKRFLQTIRSFGGISLVATSVDDVRDFFKSEGIIN